MNTCITLDSCKARIQTIQTDNLMPLCRYVDTYRRLLEVQDCAMAALHVGTHHNADVQLARDILKQVAIAFKENAVRPPAI